MQSYAELGASTIAARTLIQAQPDDAMYVNIYHRYKMEWNIRYLYAFKHTTRVYVPLLKLEQLVFEVDIVLPELRIVSQLN